MAEGSINIDLIPIEEKVRRSKEKARKIALGLAVFLFIAGGAITGYLVYYSNSLDQIINEKTLAVDEKKKKISDKSALEILVRNLDTKQKSLTDILSKRVYYSKLLEELSSRVPGAVSINSLDSSSPTQLNISGSANDYVALAKFLNSLANPTLSTSSANSKENNMFKSVAINSVTLDPITANAKFSLSLGVDTKKLTKE